MSTSYSTLSTSIKNKFTSFWDTSTTPIKFDGVKVLKKGNGTVNDETKLNEWCHLSIVTSDAFQGDMNAVKLVRITGTIFVNVYVKAGESDDRALELADVVATNIQLTMFDSVLTRAAMVDQVGQTPDKQFYQVTVRIPFQRDEYV